MLVATITTKYENAWEMYGTNSVSSLWEARDSLPYGIFIVIPHAPLAAEHHEDENILSPPAGES